VAIGAARQAAEEVAAAGTPEVHERYIDVRQRALDLLT
jgi:xylulokinase